MQLQLAKEMRLGDGEARGELAVVIINVTNERLLGRNLNVM